jgi:hypothetical protein
MREHSLSTQMDDERHCAAIVVDHGRGSDKCVDRKDRVRQSAGSDWLVSCGDHRRLWGVAIDTRSAGGAKGTPAAVRENTALSEGRTGWRGALAATLQKCDTRDAWKKESAALHGCVACTGEHAEKTKKVPEISIVSRCKHGKRHCTVTDATTLAPCNALLSTSSC